jgi:replicative DNA helicase
MNENLEKLPPQNIPMEVNVLGAMLIDRDAALVAWRRAKA